MVIACPNCQRKYQIDTTRIPPGGTTFTCWTCRASVPVGASVATPSEPVAQKREEPVEAATPRPALPRRPDPPSVKADMPDTARRFFESLAAERIHQRKPSGPLAPPIPPPIVVAPPLSPLGPDVSSATMTNASPSATAAKPAGSVLPPVDVSTARSVPPAPKAVDAPPDAGFIAPPPSGPLPSGPLPPLSGRSSGALGRSPGSGPLVTRRSTPLPDEPIDVFGDEDAQTTASLTPRRTAKDDILDLNLFPAPPVVAREPDPVFSAPQATLVMSSVPAPPEAEAMVRKAPNGHSKDIGAGITMPIRPPAPAPIDVLEPSAVQNAAVEQETTPLPAVAKAEEHVEVVEPEPPRVLSRPRLTLPQHPPVVPIPPVVPELPPDPPQPMPERQILPATSAATVVTRPAARVGAVAMSPADVASTYVAPAADARRRRKKLPFAIPVMPLVAVFTVLVCGFIVWNFVLRDRLEPAPPRQSAPQAQANPTPAPAPSGNAAITTQAATPKVTPPQPTSTTASTAPPTPPNPSPNAVTGSAYTLQIMSAKVQAESQAAVTRLSGAGANAYITQADLGARGTWYRVRVGQYATKAEAQSAGAKLVSSGQISTFIIVPYESAH
jgi:cell division septation protein DedD